MQYKGGSNPCQLPSQKTNPVYNPCYPTSTQNSRHCANKTSTARCDVWKPARNPASASKGGNSSSFLLKQLSGPRQPSRPQRCSHRGTQHLWKQHRSIGTHLGIHAPARRPRKRHGAIPRHRSRHRISHGLHGQPRRHTRPHQPRRHHF